MGGHGEPVIMGARPVPIFTSGPAKPIRCRAKGPCNGTPVRGLTFLEEGVSLLTIGAPMVARTGAALRAMLGPLSLRPGLFRNPLQVHLLTQAFSLSR
jgi:hypothetical protein